MIVLLTRTVGVVTQTRHDSLCAVHARDWLRDGWIVKAEAVDGACRMCPTDPPIPASSPVAVIRARIAELQACVGGRTSDQLHDDIDIGEARIAGEWDGLEFALRALGVES